MNQQTSDFIKKTSPDTLRQHLQDGFGYITIIILSVVYLATSFVTLSPSGKTVQQILIDGFAYAALSLAMDRLFALQGCRNGERDARVMSTIAAHGRAVDSVAGWFDRLEVWCEQESAAALAKIRAAILSKEGMKYDTYFDGAGEALGYERDEMPKKYEAHEDDLPAVAFKKLKMRVRWEKAQKQREWCYRRAMRCSITPLTPASLTGFAGKMDDPYDFGSSALERESRGSLTGIVSKAATMLLVGYIGVELLEDFSYETLILRSLQIALSLAMGVIRYYRSYMYVTEEYRGKIIKKIDCLQMFEAAMKREGIANEHDKKDDGKYGRPAAELCAAADHAGSNPQRSDTTDDAEDLDADDTEDL